MRKLAKHPEDRDAQYDEEIAAAGSSRAFLSQHLDRCMGEVCTGAGDRQKFDVPDCNWSRGKKTRPGYKWVWINSTTQRLVKVD